MPQPNVTSQPPKPAATEPLSSEQIAEIEERRKMDLLSKVRTLREGRQLRKGAVDNQKKGKSYIWVNISENRQIEFQSMGYEICRDPDIKSRWRQPDGTHRRGDLILYQIDKELLEAIKVDDELRALEGIEAPKAALHQAIGRLGGAVYDPTPR